MILASGNDSASVLMHHLRDHPWPGCQVEIGGMTFTWMSSAIASMLIVAGLLMAVILPMARRYRRQALPVGGGPNLVEALVMFVRDLIAKPALHDKADTFLPLLLTMFVYILGMNLIGLIPLQGLSSLLGWDETPIGQTPTMIVAVCASLASLSFLSIVGMGLARTAQRYQQHKGWPRWLAVAASPVLWFMGLAPSVPGAVGALLAVPLASLEFIGTLAKCFSLMIRLFANMFAGHALLASLLMLIFQVTAAHMRVSLGQMVGVSAACILGSVAVDLMELLVAGLQAYIFTFLTAMFLGLYVEPEH